MHFLTEGWLKLNFKVAAIKTWKLTYNFSSDSFTTQFSVRYEWEYLFDFNDFKENVPDGEMLLRKQKFRKFSPSFYVDCFEFI